MQPLAGLFLDWSVGHTVPGRVEEKVKKVNEKGERQNERKPKAAYAVLPSL
jgi:hypothetical protein